MSASGVRTEVSSIWESAKGVEKALRKDIQSFFIEQKIDDESSGSGELMSSNPTSPPWHFTHFREETVKHPYIVLIGAVATVVLAKLVATLIFYSSMAVVIGVSLLFTGSVICELINHPQQLLSKLNTLPRDHKISNVANKVWSSIKNWLNPLNPTATDPNPKIESTSDPKAVVKDLETEEGEEEEEVEEKDELE